MIVLAGCGNRSIMNLRGNLFKNYSYDFGVVGFIMAVLHLLLGVFFKKVFVLNESMRNQVKFLQGKVTVIPNFVDEENIKILAKRPVDLFLAEKIRLVFVGNLIKRKGLEDFLRVLAKLRGQNWSFHIIGDGPLLNDLQTLCVDFEIEDRVHFTGKIDEPVRYLRNFNYFVLPSYSEGTSRASLEALTLGLRCILRDVDSNKEIVPNDRYGYLFTTSDELHEVMVRILILSEKQPLIAFYQLNIHKRGVVNYTKSTFRKFSL